MNQKATGSLHETGELLLKTYPMPRDLNANGDIFGGWVLSEMDVAGAVLASQTAGGRVATVGVESMTFFRPVKPGSIVTLYGEVARTGRTSVGIRIETYVQNFSSTGAAEDKLLVTEGVFTYVALNEDGSKRPLPVDQQNID